MKARVKATGEIIELCNMEYDEDGNEYYRDELAFIDDFEPDYWKKLHHQYAGMAMQGILSNPVIELDFEENEEACVQAVARVSIKLAIDLVNKLKEEENEPNKEAPSNGSKKSE